MILYKAQSQYELKGDIRSIIKYAWLPKKVSNGDIIWLQYYRSYQKFGKKIHIAINIKEFGLNKVL